MGFVGFIVLKGCFIHDTLMLCENIAAQIIAGESN